MNHILEHLQGQPHQTIEAGAILLEEGKPSGKIFVLISGAVEILKGRTRISKSSAPGAIFGEVSILLGGAPIATARTLQPSTFVVIEDGARHLLDHPEFAIHVARLLASRLDALTRYLADLKAQYEGQPGVGMVDEILESLIHHQSSKPPAR